MDIKADPWICGGLDDSSVTYGNCYLYKNEGWQISRSMQLGRAFTNVVKFPSKIDSLEYLVVAGKNIGRRNALEVNSGQAWSTLPTVFPLSITFLCSLTINAYSVMVIGGNNLAEYPLRTTYIFQPPFLSWIQGPKLNTGRESVGCGRIRRTKDSMLYSIITAGGLSGSTPLKSVEILDHTGSVWRFGPDLPTTLFGSVLIEEPNGGVFLIGGKTSSTVYGTADMYFLSDAEPGSHWIKINQRLKYPRSLFVTFYIPDDVVNCTIV